MLGESKHTLGTFEHALENLRNNVMMMASQTERSLNRALKGLMERDDKLSALAIADDEEIDQLEKQIDKDGIELLLRFQPVASDLRRVVSAMKLSSNLERIADQATNIARKARKLNKHPALPEIFCLPRCRSTPWRCSAIAWMLTCAKMHKPRAPLFLRTTLLIK